MSNKVSSSDSPRATELVFNQESLRVGDVLMTRSRDQLTSCVQSVLGVSSISSDSAHTAIVAEINDKTIVLIESCMAPGRSGVLPWEYTPEHFRECYGRELTVLRNEDLQGDIAAVASRFVENYGSGRVATDYGISHVFQAVFCPSKSTKRGRLRTLHSRRANALMTSKGDVRKKAICPEVVSEAIRIAQINRLTKRTAEEEAHADLAQDEKKLAYLEQEGFVLDVTSKRITPGRLEERLVEKHDFQRRIVNPLVEREIPATS